MPHLLVASTCGHLLCYAVVDTRLDAKPAFVHEGDISADLAAPEPPADLFATDIGTGGSDSPSHGAGDTFANSPGMNSLPPPPAPAPQPPALTLQRSMSISGVPAQSVGGEVRRSHEAGKEQGSSLRAATTALVPPLPSLFLSPSFRLVLCGRH